MDMKTYLRQASPEQREELAVAVKSSVGYFYLIGGRHKRPGSKLCQRLVEAEPLLTLHELRPDIWPALDLPPTHALNPTSTRVAVRTINAAGDKA